jgi:RNA polymerase sigma factor (sigma-70 family)
MGGAMASDRLTEHLPGLRRYARFLTRCPHRADDLVQECLERAIRSADRLKLDAPVRPWLFRILHNIHVSERRRHQVRAVYDGLAGEDAIPAPQYDHMELRNVLDALALLPETQREALCLVALEDLSYVEAADVLNIPVGTLMSRLARGREALRLVMEGKLSGGLHVVGGHGHGR